MGHRLFRSKYKLVCLEKLKEVSKQQKSNNLIITLFIFFGAFCFFQPEF